MRRVTAWLSWFAVLLIAWLLFVGVAQDVENLAGLCAAAIGATAAEAVRSQELLRFRIQSQWLLPGLRQVLRVVPDFLRVIAVLARPRSGAFRTLAFPAGGERDVDHGRRAWAALTASLAPNRLVVDFDPDNGEALVHDLVPSAASRTVL